MVTKPYDEAIDAAVKAQEKKTGKKAPYFGAETQTEALKLDAWKEIGKAYKRAPRTCWGAYIEHYGNERQIRSRKGLYTAEAKAEVLRGERDADLKNAAALCDHLGRRSS